MLRMIVFCFVNETRPQVCHLFETVGEALHCNYCDRMGISIRYVQAFERESFLVQLYLLLLNVWTRARRAHAVTTQSEYIVVPYSLQTF